MRRRAWCLWSVCFVSSCATPWLDENGKKIGTINVVETGSGSIHEYRDFDDLLLKVERRDLDGRLEDGAAVTRYKYDDDGQVAAVVHANRQGALVPDRNGIAAELTRRGLLEEGQAYVETRYFDARREAAPNDLGYARKVLIYETEPYRLRKVKFQGADGEPVYVEVLGVAGTSELRVSYLRALRAFSRLTFHGHGGRRLEHRPFVAAQVSALP